MLPFHSRAANAAACTNGHFNEALLQTAFLDIVQRRNAIVDTVNNHVSIVVGITIHGAKDTARGGEQTSTAFLQRIFTLLNGDALLLEPIGQLFKGEHTVHQAGISLCFRLFGDAGSNKHGFDAGIFLLDLLTMGLHRRKHRCQIRQNFRIVLFHQGIHGMAASGNDNLLLALTDNILVFGLHNRGADCSFLSAGEAQLLQSLLHGSDGGARVVGHERGRQTGDDRTALDQLNSAGHIIADLLGVLGTYHKTLTAENTFVTDNLCLARGIFDGFHGTVANAFVTVHTVGFLQL